MYILGINISHHSSVCLLKDGEIVFYQEEERVSKIKMHCPINILLKIKNIRASLEGTQNHDPSHLLYVKSLEEITKYTNKIEHVIFSSYGHRLNTIIINTIKDQLDNLLEIGKVHHYQEHHLYHACSAFYSSGFDSALSIVLDGGGFRKTFEDISSFQEQESVYLFDYNNIIDIFKHFSNYHDYQTPKDEIDFIYEKEGFFFSNSFSCGGIFNLISTVIGFGGGEAGKTMGLAAYGIGKNVTESWFSLDNKTGIWTTNSNEIIRSFQQRFEVRENLFSLIEAAKISEVSELVAADLARKAQVETLEHTVRLIDKYTKLTGEKNVVLSGGYFLNCSNNYEYIKRFPDLNFFVDPIAHDGGTAIGAAKYLHHKSTGDKTIRKLETLYLGS
jgi:carbamoyltransferase